MQSSEQVVNRILDLDRQAERVRAKAREEAETIRREVARRIAEEKEQLEKRIAERAGQIEAEAIQTRSREIDGVKKEFADQVKAVSGVSQDTLARVVDMVVSRIRERA
jgi:F0F1-type ATP synthase membrane subunit b/b'